MSLWVPPRVSQELRQETEQHRAQIMSLAERKPVMDKFNEALKSLDEHLQLIWWPPNADHVAGMTPGAYHVLRDAPGAPPMVEPVVDDYGNPTEPTWRLFDKLQANDLWNDRAVHERREIDKRAEQAARKMREQETAERQEEILDRINALTRASVSMNKGQRGWTQTATARRQK